uniref:toll/interleukin-1 receptor domain-containing protein n=1 Tax=Lachnospira sp. TaxID=2049031 RepID=UPI003FF0009D
MADIDELKKKLEDGWIKGEPYVFVSYASKDKEKVYDFVYELRKRGINVYIDIELQENISKNWLQNIKERLYDVDCVAMISFLSISYFRSYACLIEQLVTRSEDLKMEKGRYLENFYIALDDNMSTIQKMEDAVYDNTVAKESQSMAIKMVPEEVNVLKDVMEDNIAVKSKLKKDVRSTIDGLNTAHRVAISMLSYIFKESSYSIQKYGTAGDCAQLMYNNFTNDKNDKINIDVLEELKEKYNNDSVADKNNIAIDSVAADDSVTAVDNTNITDNTSITDNTNITDNTSITDSTHIKDNTRTRQATSTGDIRFMLYGKEYELNQSDMMLTFFAHVLNKHQDIVDELPSYNGMTCVSDVDYSLPKNRKADMPTYFRSCEFFEFANGSHICVGTSYSVVDKLKKMALLLNICGESPEIFSSEQVELPAVKVRGGSSAVGKGSGALVKFSVYGNKYEQNQTDMLGTICSSVITKHPDKLEEAADALLCLDVKDYTDVAKEDRPVYFSSMNRYEVNGTAYSVGGSFGMKEKLKMIARLLIMCDESKDIIDIEDYEIPDVKVKAAAGTKKKINYFD